MLTRAKPANWGTGEKLTSAQMNYIDAQLPFAIDGNAGGTYHPSNTIHIGTYGITLGDGAEFTCMGGSAAYFNDVVLITETGSFECRGPATCNGGLVVGGGSFVVMPGITSQLSHNVYIGSSDANSLNVNATATFNAPATFASPVAFSQLSSFVLGFTVAVGGISVWGADAVQLSNTGIYAGGGTQLDGPVVINGTATINGATTIAGATALAGAVLLSAVITPTGSGRMLSRFHSLPDDSVTVSIADGNIFLVPLLGYAQSYTVSSVGAQLGDVILFSAEANTGPHLAQMLPTGYQLRNVAGWPAAGVIWFDGSSWRPLLSIPGS